MTDGVPPVPELHAASAHENQAAEVEVRSRLLEQLGPLAPGRIALAEGVVVDVDGVSPDRSCFVEIFAHRGKLIGGQKRKVATDVLKLIALRRIFPEERLIIALTGADADKSVGGWLRFVAESHGVQIIAIDLGDDWDRRLDAVRELQRNGMQQIKRLK